MPNAEVPRMKSLHERMKEVWQQTAIVKNTRAAYVLKQKAADNYKRSLEKAQARLSDLQDDLMGDLLNGCFPEAPLEGELAKIAEEMYRGNVQKS